MSSIQFRDMKALVVDDMFNMRRTLKNMLRYIGFEKIIEAGDGEKALELLQREKVDLVVSDWNMPTMSGIDLLRKVRQIEHHRNVPFIMITAEVSEANIIQAAESDVDGYMIKPFVARSLEEKINTIFQNRADPTPMEKTMKAGQLLMDAGSYDAAAREFAVALDMAPNSARARQALGEAYAKAGKDGEAEKNFAEAIKINPQFLKAYESMADLYAAQGKDDKALALLEKAGAIAPMNASRQLKIGKLYMGKGEKDKADRALMSALANAPHDADVHTSIGEIYLEVGDDARAAKAFSSSIHIVESVHVYNRLGIALRKKGEYMEALKVYQQALKIEPENEGLLFNIARLKYAQGQSREALTILRKALAIDPDFVECKELLNKIERATGQAVTP